jgi:phosphatidyl-myo-inositol dimannoside synthase
MNVTVVCEGFNRDSLFLQPWRRVYEISKRMGAKEGVSVTIISDGRSTAFDQEVIDGISIKRIDKLMLRSFIRGKKIKQFILETNPDVVIWYGTPFSAFYLNNLRTIRKPIVWDFDTDLPNLTILKSISLREFFHPDHRSLSIHLLTLLLPKLIIKNIANSKLISGIIVPSTCIKVSLVKIGVRSNKIEVISSTINKTDNMSSNKSERDVLRSELDLSKEEFVMLYFGSPCTLRGTDTAVLSMKKIAVANKNVKLILLSRRDINDFSTKSKNLEDEERYLKNLVKKLNLEGNVKIIPGLMNKAKLREYLSASDVVVLPFKFIFSEPPLAIFEAMLLGKTVIASNLGTISEILSNDRGIIVKPNRPDELAKAVLSLKSGSRNSEISEKAMKFASALPDWDTITENLLCFLYRVTQNN